ncbi:MAG: hypothetical protein ABRQ31_02150, partial [Smithellaceae bacterium]
MNFYRILARIFIAAMLFFLACGGSVSAAESPVSPDLKAKEKVLPVKTNREGGDCPAFQTSAGSSNRNTIGCVLPLTGGYGESGNKALDSILLAAG